MADIQDDVRRIFDHVEPIGLDEIEAVSRRRRHRHRRLLAVGTGTSVAAAITVAVVLTSGTSPTKVTVGPSATQPPVSQTNPPATGSSVPLSATLSLSSTSVPAGGTLTGKVIVENNTGAALHPVTCGLYQAVLANNSYQPEIPWPLCATLTTIPVGRSSYPVTILARYYDCVPNNSPPCVDQQPLPPGTYQAKVSTMSLTLPVPAPVAVTVTPSTVSAQQTVTVPNVAGQTSATASRVLAQVGLAVNQNSQSSNTVPAGIIAAENPAPGSIVVVGSTISITVSTGPASHPPADTPPTT